MWLYYVGLEQRLSSSAYRKLMLLDSKYILCSFACTGMRLRMRILGDAYGVMRIDAFYYVVTLYFYVN